ncbi:MAG: hypothetical protein NW237_14490 [Cyanobacteriota bacterium]|nr:hypothetical protein [Cyanobacteriota bacterium]
MGKFLKPLALVLASFLVLILVGTSHVLAGEDKAGATAAEFASPRQFYSDWVKTPQFSFRTYYYKPTPSYAGYKHQFVIYTPTKPDYLYYFNPYEKKFWGRIQTFSKGEPKYSLLKSVDQKSVLSEIPESAFPDFGPLPAMPEVQDQLVLDLPPDDSPSLLARLVEDAKINQAG